MRHTSFVTKNLRKRRYASWLEILWMNMMIWRMSTTRTILRIILRTVQTAARISQTIPAKTVLRILVRTVLTAQILQTTDRFENAESVLYTGSVLLTGKLDGIRLSLACFA